MGKAQQLSRSRGGTSNGDAGSWHSPTLARASASRPAPTSGATAVLLALVLLVSSGCTLASVLALDPIQGLPSRATPQEVGVIDNAAVVETPDDVLQTAIHSPVVGTLYEPANLAGRVPAVLFLGGSSGYDVDQTAGPDGLDAVAKHLAAHGFVVLNLCYFGCAGRPLTLDQISLEYVLSAVSYLRGLPEVDASSLNALGFSRGAELALITGAYSQDVRGVIAVSGSPWVLDKDGTPAGDCAWTINGSCLPVGSLIPVQQIRGPVLLLHGQFDAIWPLAYSEQLSAELDNVQHPHTLTVFPNVGHTFGSLNCLIGTNTCQGYSPVLVSVPWDAAANVNATRIMFAQILALLRSEVTGDALELPVEVGSPSGLASPPETSAIPTPAAPGTVIFSDTMQDPDGRRLPTSNEPDGRSRGYRNGTYVVTLPAASGLRPGQTSQFVTALPGVVADATLSSDVRLDDPSADQFVSLACRSQKLGAEYRFVVVPFSGKFSLVRWIDPTHAAPFVGGFQTSSAIRTGSDMNMIELRCQSDRIEGLINGTSVVSVSDFTFRSGEMWLAVGQTSSLQLGGHAASAGNVKAEFSRVLVTQQ
jgi:dienelactone hydrolase